MLAAVRLPRKAQYAICGVFDLAYNGQGEAVQIRAISERQAIPARYLEQIFQRLRRAGLVTSKRGPGGGYRLARAPEAITLREVVEAVEGPFQAGPVAGVRRAATRYRPDFFWPALASGFAALLDRTSLESLCRDASRAAVERAAPPPPMYFI
jgi:Rrf2 family iron-sulfur cluster assembly transcriptional regulator